MKRCVLTWSVLAVTSLGVSSISLAQPAAAPTTAPTTKKAKLPLPPSVADVGELGENIYDAVSSDNWAKASTKLDALKAAMVKVKTDIPNPTKAQQTRIKELDAGIAELDKAIPAKDHQAAMMRANRIARVGSVLAASFQTPFPLAISQLDYLGRELEVWSNAKDLTKLQGVAKRISQTWGKARADVEAKGGTAQAKKFNDLVATVLAAKTVEDYSKSAKPILDAVDDLEKVYTK